MRHPAIDHSLLSPSGTVSKRARKAAMQREHDRLFPPGYWDAPKLTEQEAAQQEAQTLRRSAGTLRDLAARGMQRRTFTRKAEQLERQADELEATI